MSSLRVMDMLKLTFKVLEFKYEQNKLTTSIFSTVNTDKGAIKGVKRLTIWGDAYFSFEKIPYAKPPLGKLRFKAPLPADNWDGVLNCTGPADKPLQSNVFFRRWKGSEDCLYLNVFTKNLTPTKLRPVMVWIFGGGFQIGEATRDMFSPDFFMSKDIVLVTIAYRLGPFGFLSMNDPSADVPGNAGIKDQILSLRWVQANIAAFGGDPENVTLFGESAGGASTHLCMLSEQSKGLFHKAIIMSGSALCPWARPPNNDFPYRFAKRLGYMGKQNDVEVLEFLQAVSGPDLVKMSGTILSKEEKHNRILFAFGPVVEPYDTDQCILSEDPRIVMQTTWSNQIPLMLGGTSFEGLLFHPEVTRRPATLEEVGDCKNLLPLDIAFVLEEYAATLKHTYFGDKECNMQTLMKFLDLESYREFWHPMYRIARCRLQVNAAPTYLYRFDYDSRDGNAIRNILVGRNSTGACHGDDLCYIFFAMFSHRPAQNSPEYKITRTMIGLWTSFAESGDPNCDMLEELIFEPLASDEPMKCLNISDKLEFMELPELKKLKVWDSFYAQGKL